MSGSNADDRQHPPGMEAEPNADDADLLRALLRDAPDVILRIDRDGRIRDANAAAELVTGYGPAGLMGRPFDEVIQPDQRARVAGLVGEALEGRPQQLDVTLLQRSGGSVELRGTLIPIRQHEAATGVLGLLHDVTATNRTERELRQAGESFESVFGSTWEGIAIHDAGRIVAVNEAFAALLGYTPDELLGVARLELVDPADRPAVAARVAASTPEPYQVNLLRKDGARLAAALVERPIQFQGRALQMTTARDVTERLRAEAGRNWLAAVVASSDDGIYATALDGVATAWNAAAERLYGYTADEMLGQPLAVITPPERAAELDTLLAAARRGEEVLRYETQHRRRDGTTIDVAVTASAIRDDAGAIVGASMFARDITEQLRAERALRESEERFRLTLSSAPFGMALTTIDGQFLQVNQAMCDMLGYTENELLRESYLSVTHPDDRAASARRIARILAGEEESYTTERRYLHHDGHIIWVLGSVVLVRDTTGNPRYFIGQVLDISDRKAAEAALRESEERFRQIVETANEGIWLHDERGHTTFVNPRMAAMLGYDPAEILGRPLVDFMDETERATAAANLERRQQGISEQHDFRFRRKDGTEIWTGIETNPILGPDGSYRGALGMLTDVTVRRHSEDELRRLTATLELRVHERTAELEDVNTALRADRALIEAIRQAQANFILSATPSESFGVLLDSLLSLTGSAYGFIYELQHTPTGEPYLVALAITDISWNEQTRAMYPRFLLGELTFSNMQSLFGAVVTTGEPVIANDAPHDPRRAGIPPGHPALDAFLGLPLYAGGELIGVIGLANRPGGYAEEAIRYLQPLVAASGSLMLAWRNERRRRVQEAELTRRTAQLDASNRDLEAFAYSISHDLRSPLRVLGGFARILAEEYREQVPDEARAHLQRIIDASLRMNEMIDAVLLFSRVSRQEMRVQPVDLSALVQAVLEELRPANGDRRVVTSVDGLPPCTGDRTLLRMVFANLLDNAFKFTRDRDPVRIEVGWRAEKGEPGGVYYVRDNGAGFNMRYADRLFGVFQRLHTEREFMGTGVGLANVQRIVQRHGGRVWAEGVPGEGATFYLTLPHDERAPVEAVTLPAAS